MGSLTESLARPDLLENIHNPGLISFRGDTRYDIYCQIKLLYELINSLVHMLAVPGSREYSVDNPAWLDY